MRQKALRMLAIRLGSAVPALSFCSMSLCPP
jgi:hypothetical protein